MLRFLSDPGTVAWTLIDNRPVGTRKWAVVIYIDRSIDRIAIGGHIGWLLVKAGRLRRVASRDETHDKSDTSKAGNSIRGENCGLHTPSLRPDPCDAQY